VKLALDHHYSTAIAQQLRTRKHDVVAALERGWQLAEDEPLLVLCVNEQRALLTNNVADFAVLARRWAAEGRLHYGMMFTSDSTMPRNARTIGRYVRALHDLMRSNPSVEALVNRVEWL
jgi:hypothetical protein